MSMQIFKHSIVGCIHLDWSNADITVRNRKEIGLNITGYRLWIGNRLSCQPNPIHLTTTRINMTTNRLGLSTSPLIGYLCALKLLNIWNVNIKDMTWWQNREPFCDKIINPLRCHCIMLWVFIRTYI